MKRIMILPLIFVGLMANAEPTITDVKAQQRYPWNGKVDISYMVENAGAKELALSVWAVDQATGITNVAKSVTGETAYTSGQHKIVWDMSADGLTLVSTSVVFAVSYKEAFYCVIDLSGGTSASSYPVTYLNDVPSGGWSDEYRTTKLVLRKVSEGTFTMGSPEGESGRSSGEPQHQVTLTKDYYMGVFPVTQRQWELVKGTRPSYFNNNDYYAVRPVENVSYDMIRGSSAGAGWPNSSDVDATSFLGVLRAKSGLQLDLPTEAQWEYACRAGTTTALNSGKNLTSMYQDSEMDKVGRYYYNGGSGGESYPACSWSRGTAKVGSYVPNAWGLYDMHGNVHEWCLDWNGKYSGDVIDPKGPSSGSYRVMRGGSWGYDAYGCRSAHRGSNYPSYENRHYGFRLVRILSNTAVAETAARNEAVAATSGGAGVQGESDPVRVDLRTGTRTAAKTETITYSTAWVDGAGEDAVAVVSVSGEVVSKQSGSGTVEWVPTRNGTYELTHKVMVDGEQIGETVTATFLVSGLPTITDVTAQQRYPWNGKVDISYTVEDAGTETRELSVWAVDLAAGITNIAKSVTGDTAYTSGQHKIVWDMAADGLTLASTNVIFGVSYVETVKPEGLYCVIDLSGGTSASSYPITYLDDVPSGGWSDEYKTSKLVLRRISAGTFTMGSPTDELGRDTDYDETQHQVTLTKDYYMGVFQLTQRQWELVMGTRPSYFNNDSYYAPRPVEQVSYNMIRGSSAGAGWPNSSAVDATSFLGVLRAKSGLQLDLPTEAQWEYACRAGTTMALNSGKNLTNPWGQDSEMDKVGRYYYNGGSGGSGSQSCDWSNGTAKVGSYTPNDWGFYDMHGNVNEWCLDRYEDYSGDETDPKGSSSGSFRVMRGACWCFSAAACRSAYRCDYSPSYGHFHNGFRLVRILSDVAVPGIAATSGGAGVQGVSDPVRIDLTTGMRTAAKTEAITYSTAWVEGAGEDAVAVVSVGGEVVSKQSGSGTVEWVPTRNGTYELTHKVMVNGKQIGETMTAMFSVSGLPEITDVTAQQRYPWNGKVDISYMLENAGAEAREISVWAVDQMTGVTNVAKSITGDIAYTSGQHKIVWDMAADGLTLISTNVVFGVSYVVPPPLYCVIDLSGGASATSCPVTYLDEVPSGGWSDEYKTTKLVLRKIGAGTFTMGGRSTDYPDASDEGIHQVTLTKGYWMGIFPVTQRQWELVMGTRPSYFNNDAYYAPRPVEKVSYNMIRGSSAGAGWPNSSDVDATSFLGVLRAKSGLALDLPTEAQWEYACRAGTTTALNSGKNLTSTGQDAEMDKVGRYYYNSGQSYSPPHASDLSTGTAKVGSYAPNAWGLYDMHGNVEEWCLDWYGSYSGDATDPKGSSSGSGRVVRGGSWYSGAGSCRSASRDYGNPSSGFNDRGFRLVMTLSNTAVAETAARSEAVAATSGGAGVQGESDPVRVDLRTGTRTAAKTETITYSTAWVEGAGEDAVAVVSVNGEVISEQSGGGMVRWTPTRNGTYELTHQVMSGGEQIGGTMTATFVVDRFPETPVLNPESGTTFDTALTVSMTCASEEATIHYTTDGTTPTMESAAYSRKFKIYGKTTVKAIAFYEDGAASDMAVSEYAMGTCDSPVIQYEGGTSFGRAGMTVTCRWNEEDGVLRYTLDGSDPTAASAAYEDPLHLADTTTVKIKVFSAMYFDSEVVSETFSLIEKPLPPVIEPESGTVFSGALPIVITNATPGATIYYTTDGTDPTTESPMYQPFSITERTVVKAIAAGRHESAVAMAEYAPGKCDDPAVEPPDGTIFYHPGQQVVISREVKDGVLRYTLDGSDPTAESPEYAGPFTIDETTTIKSKVFGEQYFDSGIVTATLTRVWLKAASPVIAPSDGTVFEHSGQEVSITHNAEEGVLRYTTDGSDPTAESAEYAGAFAIDETTTVKAKVFGEQYLDSDVVTARLTRVWVKVATPEIKAQAQFTGSKQRVDIVCATEGATVRYTTDGKDPSSHSPEYTKPFYVTDTTTVKAYATKSDYADSDVGMFLITKVRGIGDTMGKPDHAFETSGAKGFVRVEDKTAKLGESMKSGEIEDNQRSVLSTSLIGPGTLTFKWKASCEEDDEYEWDHGEFRANGEPKGWINGVTGWIEVSQRIEGEGTNTVTWTYVKDSEESVGEDCLWVSEYVWISDYITTQTTEVPVPYDWLQEKSRDIVDEYDNYEKVAKQKAYNPRYTVEQCYVAGLDPESTTSEFKMAISMEGGFPTVTWDPDLGVLREYKVWGKESLIGGDWQHPTNSLHRFFKVSVEMP